MTLILCSIGGKINLAKCMLGKHSALRATERFSEVRTSSAPAALQNYPAFHDEHSGSPITPPRVSAASLSKPVPYDSLITGRGSA